MRVRPFLLVLAALTPLCGVCRASTSGGNTAAQILKLGAGAAHTATGDAATAYGGGASAMFWNPAGLGFMDRCGGEAGRSILFQSVNYSFSAAACPTKRLGTFGVGWQFLDYGKIDSRDNTGTVDGSFSPSDTALSGSWAKELVPGLAFGVTGKRVRVKIQESGAAYAADAGLLARFSWLSVGAAVRNMARKIEIGDTPEKLPRTYKFGAAAELHDLVFLADVNNSKDGSWLAGGLEYQFLQENTAVPVIFRAGYSTRLKTGGFTYTAGVGLKEKSWALDYALVPYGDLGVTHHLSLSVAFGPEVREEKTERAAKVRGLLMDINHPGPAPDKLILIPEEIPQKVRKL